MDGKVIYVPQGRSARLVAESSENGIKGLFSDGFSFCNILVGINQKESKILLTHVDGQTIIFTPNKLMDEIKWLGKEAECFVFLRENDGDGVFDC